MRREDLVLGQDAVDGCPKRGLLDLFGDVAKDVVDGEVGRDAVADVPVLDALADCDDLDCQVRARDEVLLLPERVLALCDDEVTVLCAHGQQWNRCRYEPRGRTCNDTA